MCLQIVFFIKLSGQLQTSRCTQIQHSGHLGWQFFSLQALISFESFLTAYSVFPKKIPSIVVLDLKCGIWEGQGARMPLMYQVRDVTLPLVNLIR